jgi:hypothetical protein
MEQANANVTKIGKAPTIEDHIIAQTEWTRFVDMPVGNTKAVRDMKEDMDVTGAGVYQIALKSEMPIDDYVSPDLGYIGMGKDVFRRVVGIRTGKHTCGKMLKQMNIPLEDVMIRFLFTEEGKEGTLEQQLHKEMNSQFKYRFKWKKASGGTAGIGTQVMDMLEKIDNPAELIDIIGKAKERYTDIMLEAALSGEIKSVVDEYFGD